MNALRTIASVTGLLLGLGGIAAALENFPWQRLSSEWGPPQIYFVQDVVFGLVAPMLIFVAAGTALILLARIDRRLENLERRSPP